ncbi:MAG: MotA/TolQ/ExbB proton channel family protein [Alkalibacterium sp.]|nr:MotA/TolQ/ExbB proton channel family protein [Alkalibacterium sp.]
MSQNSTLLNYFDVPSLIITLFGSFAAILISFPLSTLKKVPALLKKLMFTPDDDRLTLLETLTALAKKSRTQGILAIEADIQEQDHHMLKYGLEMVVDGTDVDTIEEILNVELAQTEDRHSIGQEVFLKWGEFAPAFGMIGTLVGLIAMLGDLQDPSLIGTGMATALLTTLYGALMANMVFLPVAKNLEMQTANELKTNEMIIEGILALQRGDNPRIMEQKLQSFMSNSDQKKSEKSDDETAQVAEEF